MQFCINFLTRYWLGILIFFTAGLAYGQSYPSQLAGTFLYSVSVNPTDANGYTGTGSGANPD